MFILQIGYSMGVRKHGAQGADAPGGEKRGELRGWTWDGPTNLNIVGIITPDATLSSRHK